MTADADTLINFFQKPGQTKKLGASGMKSFGHCLYKNIWVRNFFISFQNIPFDVMWIANVLSCNKFIQK